jgi:hypothetical protein
MNLTPKSMKVNEFNSKVNRIPFASRLPFRILKERYPPRQPPTLTERLNRWFADLGFTLPAPRMRGAGKVNLRSEKYRFGLSVRDGGKVESGMSHS